MWRISFSIVFVFLFLAVSRGQKNMVKELYTKKEVQIPMRDNASLFTAIYSPKDKSQKYPILFCRTPYGTDPYGQENFPEKIGPSKYIMEDGYIIVYQDARGRFQSEGKYLEMNPHIADKTNVNQVDNSTDTFDSIEWLLENLDNHNGKVGLWGISYRGFYVNASVIDAHPAIACASPQAPITDWFMGDDVHHNGVLALLPAYVFLEVLGRHLKTPFYEFPNRNVYPTRDAYNFFRKYNTFQIINDSLFKGTVPYWDTLRQHANYDSYWQNRNIRKHLRDIKPAMLVVGGLYDHENLFGSTQTYNVLANQQKENLHVVLGPWVHGGWARTTGESMGILDFGSSTSDYYQKNIESLFFKSHLKGAETNALAEAIVFETGTNTWRHYNHWPPYKSWPDTVYLNEDFGISGRKPEISGFKFDEYVSDPANPVPYTNIFHNAHLFYDKNYMVADQRFASSRPDVLTYTSAPLKDTLTIAGPIQVELHFITNRRDVDFVVKVIDEYPDKINTEQWVSKVEPDMAGYQLLIRGEVMRARYRESFSEPKPLLAGRAASVNFTLNDVNHAFLPGHKLQVQIQSSWFPLFEMNPQSYVNTYEALPKDFKKAEIQILRSSDYPTRLIFNRMDFHSGL